jgi:hypothetical protein
MQDKLARDVWINSRGLSESWWNEGDCRAAGIVCWSYAKVHSLVSQRADGLAH